MIINISKNIKKKKLFSNLLHYLEVNYLMISNEIKNQQKLIIIIIIIAYIIII